MKQRGLAADHKVRNWPYFVYEYYLGKPNIYYLNRMAINYIGITNESLHDTL